MLGVFLDEDFDVAPGIHSSLRHVVNTFNFGVVHVIPTGTGAKILGAVAQGRVNSRRGISGRTTEAGQSNKISYAKPVSRDCKTALREHPVT